MSKFKQASVGGGSDVDKKAYQPPRILSMEVLEAAAATCAAPGGAPPGVGGFGKAVPPCQPKKLGS